MLGLEPRDPRSARIDLETVKRLKEVERGRIRDYADEHREARYIEGGSAWDIPCQVALPCATQNELDERAARTLLANGCIAGGAATSAPEMQQNASRDAWTFEFTEQRLPRPHIPQSMRRRMECPYTQSFKGA